MRTDLTDDPAMHAPSDSTTGTPGNPPGVVNCAVYGSLGRRDVALDTVGRALADDPTNFAWIGLYEPGDDVLTQLQAEFDLHALAIEDAGKAH